MRKHLAIAATAFFLLPASTANALTVGTVSGLQRSLAETSTVERVVRICNRNVRTGQETCWTDRSRPPTVCHVIRRPDGSRRIDCY